MAACEQDPVVSLVEAHVPLADRVVGRVAAAGLPRHVCRDDLRSAALLALYQAAQRFDPARGVPFEHYASRRMRGAVLDELRSTDWATRAARTRGHVIDAAAQRLSQGLGRVPSLEEVATEVGMCSEDVLHAQHDEARASVLQLEALHADHGGEMPLGSADAGPEHMVLEYERKQELDDAIERLSDRHGAVIRGYYFEERKLLDLADDFGVSDSRVCQIRAEGIKALRDVLVGADA
jgi:RNA polymerase sigma factor for flagellar operon FliA